MNIVVRPSVSQSNMYTGEEMHISLTTEPGDSPELVTIVSEHLPAWLELFSSKNSEYGSGAAFELGARGQFSDMYRKMIKLKRAMWDADESVLKTEGVDEIINDLIGHCFLTLEMRRRDRAAADENMAGVAEGHDSVELIADGQAITLHPVQTRTYQREDGTKLTIGDSVRLKQHLEKGSDYTLLDIDQSRSKTDGMSALCVDPLDLRRVFWTNPEWLEKV